MALTVTIPSGIAGGNVLYLDGENGFDLDGSLVTQWDDQSGYVDSAGRVYYFRRDANNERPTRVTSSTIDLTGSADAHYVRFTGNDRLPSINETGAWNVMPFPGYTGTNPFYDFYAVVAVSSNTGFSSSPNRDYWFKLGAAGGDTGYIGLTAQGDGQSLITGVSATAAPNGAPWPSGAKILDYPVGDDNWRIVTVHYAYNSVRVYVGKTEKANLSVSQGNMASSTYGWLGGNGNPYASNRTNSLNIMFLAAFVNTAAHTTAQRESMVDAITTGYPGGSGGGSALL